MRRIALLAGSVLVLALLVLAIPQLLLPGIAAGQLRDRLKRSGNVLKVEVDAFPALELLWHHADHVVVRMADYSSPTGELSRTLSQVADVGSLDASAGRMTVGLLTLHHARLRKQGNQLKASASVSQADLRASFPVLGGVQAVASSQGQVTLRGTGTVLGITVTVDATVGQVNGALVVSPNIPIVGLATIPLFSNPKIAVEGVAATPTAQGFALTALGRLR